MQPWWCSEAYQEYIYIYIPCLLYDCFNPQLWLNHPSVHPHGCLPAKPAGAMDVSVCLFAACLASWVSPACRTDANAVCAFGQGLVVPTAAATDHWSISWKLLVVLLVGIMLGIFFGWRAHGWWSSFARRPTNTVTQQRDVATQSQVRFAWGRAEPRFVPLADREHGAWLVD